MIIPYKNQTVATIMIFIIIIRRLVGLIQKRFLFC